MAACNVRLLSPFPTVGSAQYSPRVDLRMRTRSDSQISIDTLGEFIILTILNNYSDIERGITVATYSDAWIVGCKGFLVRRAPSQRKRLCSVKCILILKYTEGFKNLLSYKQSSQLRTHFNVALTSTSHSLRRRTRFNFALASPSWE